MAGDDASVAKAGEDFLTAMVKDDDRLVDPKVTFVIDGTSVTGTATAKIAPIFVELPVTGPKAISAHTKVMRAVNTTLELALVLDTTGSMSGSKLTTLKTASKSLVTTLTNDKGAEVKIAVVPFANYVNVGVARRLEPWLNVPNDYDQTVPGKCTTKTETTTCQSETYSCTKYNDGVPYQSTCSRTIPGSCVTKTLNPPQTTCTKDSVTRHKFSGCVGSPAYPKNVTDNDPLRIYPGYLDLTCGTELTTLTDKAPQIISAINALSASGETYIPAGLAWGFNALSSAQPLTDAQPYDKAGPNKKPRKVLVLMTDGENTKLMRTSNGKHDISPGTGNPATQANTFTTELCNNIKAEKIELYTVAFEVGDPDAKALVAACATDKDHYFEANDAAALISAFEAIAAALQNLFIAQ